MKRLFGIVLILFVAGFTVLSYADAGDTSSQRQEIKAYRLQIGEKAARGVKNILLGWTELPKRIINKTKETGNPIWGFAVGTYEGALKTAVRTLSGVVDVVTAPIDPEGPPFVPVDIEKIKL